ncbi:hypothetical protein C8F01DRAFT_1243870 [Mycena amicta]|nr:hypothetical protein C8F01DRAFT_1243870 [Mycena amicta]
MPLATDLAWPHALVKTFNIARNSTSKNPYLGAHLKLITYCFDRSFDFTYVCQTGDSMVYLVVFDDVRPEQCPVLLIQVNDDEHKLSLTERQAADKKMWKRYNDLLRECTIPSLYGLSVQGTRMRVYCRDKAHGTVEPVDEANLPDDFLKGGGYERFFYSRLSLLDYLHRGVVYTLLGIPAYSIFVGVNGHSARRAGAFQRGLQLRTSAVSLANKAYVAEGDSGAATAGGTSAGPRCSRGCSVPEVVKNLHVAHAFPEG